MRGMCARRSPDEGCLMEKGGLGSGDEHGPLLGSSDSVSLLFSDRGGGH